MNLDDIPVVLARWRGSAVFTPTMIVLHTMEAGEYSTTAENCANYFANMTDPKKKASCNYCADNDSVVCSVPPGKEAYHAGVGEINRCSVGIEMAGFASQSVNEWGDGYSTQMLYKIVLPLVDELCKRYNIPRVWLTAEDLRAGRRAGITTHREVTFGFAVSGGHTDPGENFPRNDFMFALTNQGAPASSGVASENEMFKLKNVDGRDEWFIESDGKILSCWSSVPGGSMSGWNEPKPGVKATAFTAEVGGDGRLCITAVAQPYGVLMGTWQSAPGQGPWVDWFDVNALRKFIAGQ